MERLTERGFEFTGNYVVSGLQNWSIAQCLNKLQAYEDLEEQCIKENAVGIKLLLEKWKEFMDDISELVEYRKLKEQGRLLIFPCAVGDGVYTLQNYWDCEYNYDCPLSYAEGKSNCEIGLRCDREHRIYTIINKKFSIDMLNEIGKTVFITEEEAEAALQKMKGEEHE